MRLLSQLILFFLTLVWNCGFSINIKKEETYEFLQDRQILFLLLVFFLYPSACVVLISSKPPSRRQTPPAAFLF